MSKFRSSFVTNSSSSSFICEVSGDVEAGYDMGLSEAGMYECENGHTFCECYLVGELGNYTKDELITIVEEKIKSTEEGYNANPKRTYYLDYIKEYKEHLKNLKDGAEDELESIIEDVVDSMGLNTRDGIASVHCPICTMDTIRESDMVAYLLKKNGVDESEVRNEIKANFKTLTEFTSYLK